MSAVFFVVWALGIIWAWAVFLIERRWRNRAVYNEEFDFTEDLVELYDFTQDLVEFYDVPIGESGYDFF